MSNREDKEMSEPGFPGLKDYQDFPTTWRQYLFTGAAEQLKKTGKKIIIEM